MDFDQAPSQEHHAEQTVQKRPLRKLLFLVAAGIFAVVVGFFLLRVLGQSFIQEVTQEISLREAEKPLSKQAVGEQAPYWELRSLDGSVITLTDVLDRPLVLTFWTSWNTNSANQLTIFDEVLTRSDDLPFKIVAINNQEDESVVRNFIGRGGYETFILLDETGEVGERYAIRNLPTFFFIDTNGIVQSVFVGVLDPREIEDKALRLLSK